MKKGNVLVIGNSGIGKSTLINAVLGENLAETGWGIHGRTAKLKIYEPKSANVMFRAIDTIGFEPDYFKEIRAVNAVKKWSRECAKKGNENNQINVIWFCVEGTSSKQLPKTIRNLTRAASMWKSVPVIVVITKSYSVPEREKNIEMGYQAFAALKRRSNLRKVIPVVAAPFVLNENAFAAPEGITELIDITNSLMPEGIKAAENDLARFVLNRKRALAHSVVTTAAAAGVVIGAIPVPFPDAVLLTPTEVAEVNAIAKIYGIKNDDQSKQFFNTIIEVGTVGVAAKELINAFKAIPGINLGASVINAVIAGVIVAALGEGSVYAFEQVYLGEKTLADIDWVKKIINASFSKTIIEKAKPVLAKLTDVSDHKMIIKSVLELIAETLDKGKK